MNSRFHAPRGTRGNAGLAEKETLLGEMRKEERKQESRLQMIVNTVYLIAASRKRGRADYRREEVEVGDDGLKVEGKKWKVVTFFLDGGSSSCAWSRGAPTQRHLAAPYHGCTYRKVTPAPAPASTLGGELYQQLALSAHLEPRIYR